MRNIKSVTDRKNPIPKVSIRSKWKQLFGESPSLLAKRLKTSPSGYVTPEKKDEDVQTTVKVEPFTSVGGAWPNPSKTLVKVKKEPPTNPVRRCLAFSPCMPASSNRSVIKAKVRIRDQWKLAFGESPSPPSSKFSVLTEPKKRGSGGRGCEVGARANTYLYSTLQHWIYHGMSK